MPVAIEPSKILPTLADGEAFTASVHAKRETATKMSSNPSYPEAKPEPIPNPIQRDYDHARKREPATNDATRQWLGNAPVKREIAAMPNPPPPLEVKSKDPTLEPEEDSQELEPSATDGTQNTTATAVESIVPAQQPSTRTTRAECGTAAEAQHTMKIDAPAAEAPSSSRKKTQDVARLSDSGVATDRIQPDGYDAKKGATNADTRLGLENAAATTTAPMKLEPGTTPSDPSPPFEVKPQAPMLLEPDEDDSRETMKPPAKNGRQRATKAAAASSQSVSKRAGNSLLDHEVASECVLSNANVATSGSQQGTETTPSSRTPRLRDRRAARKNNTREDHQQKRFQPEWWWLLDADGSPAVVQPAEEQTTVHQTEAKIPAGGSPNTKGANASITNHHSNSHRKTLRRQNQTTASTADARRLHTGPERIHSVKTEAPSTPTERKAESRWWCWLLEPDGTPSMASSAPSVPTAPTSPPTINDNAKKRRALARFRGQTSRWDWCLAPASPATVDETNDGNPKKLSRPDFFCRAVPPAQRRWHWLLPPDESKATADASSLPAPLVTPKAAAASRKRKAPPKSHCGQRKSSRPRRAPVYRVTYTGTETDDNDSECGAPFASSYDAQWEEKFQMLVEYKNKHKTTNVHFRHEKLGHWVVTQRRAYKAKKLKKCRLQRLESIGFDFDLYATQWNSMYNQLVLYQKENGSTRVPDTKKYKALQQWTHRQRLKYHTKSLSEESISQLESIGFEWTAQPKNEARSAHEMRLWMKTYQRLVAFKQKHNTTLVPCNYHPDPQLGKWVKSQRLYCKEEKRIDLLNYIGFVWDPNADKWMEMYQHLLAFKEKHKTTHVSEKVDPRLSRWVTRQRLYCKEEKRIDLLNNIGFVWDPCKDKWMEMYQRLLAFKEKYKTAQVPKSFQEDQELAQWVRIQRWYCSQEDRIKLLNDAGFVWNPVNGRNLNLHAP